MEDPSIINVRLTSVIVRDSEKISSVKIILTGRNQVTYVVKELWFTGDINHNQSIMNHKADHRTIERFKVLSQGTDYELDWDTIESDWDYREADEVIRGFFEDWDKTMWKDLRYDLINNKILPMED